MNMTDYNNPNDNWRKRQDYYDRRERESGEVINIIVKTLLVCLAFALFGWLLSSCTTTKYVPVTETHTEHHWHTDTVRQTDSIIDHRTTLIREVDSATMARYGIQIKDMQRAWLIETDRLQRELSRLRETKADTVTVRDSIPYPVEVDREVARPLTWWQQTRMHVGGIVIFLLIIFVVRKIYVTLHPKL